jgi:hypothetical protein
LLDRSGQARAVTSGNTCALLVPAFQNPPEGSWARTRGLEYCTLRGGTAFRWSRMKVVATNWRGLEMLPPMVARGMTSVLIGSMSKSHWAGLHIGWIRAPRSVVDLISHQRLGADLGAPLHAQVLAVDLLSRDVTHERWTRVADNHQALLRELQK